MDEFKIVLESLQDASDKRERERILRLLQSINECFLSRYMIEIDSSFKLYPIEVEAYYHHPGFSDSCVHKNGLQKNRFGKLYFHRGSSEKENSFLYDRGGFDVCLSDSDNYYFGILIRSAWINNEEKPVCGPGLLTRRIVKHISQNDIIANLSDSDKEQIRNLEDKNTILVHATDDKRDKSSPLFNSTRIGISPKTHPEYAQYNLRSLIELKNPNHPFKEKEKAVETYMRDNGKTGTAENVKELLGYVSKSIIAKLTFK
jgi:hypothetical protein